jgi:hypothetical protein
VRGVECKPTVTGLDNMAQMPLVIGKSTDCRRIAPSGADLRGSCSADSLDFQCTAASGKIAHDESLTHPDPAVYRQRPEIVFFQQAINNRTAENNNFSLLKKIRAKFLWMGWKKHFYSKMFVISLPIAEAGRFAGGLQYRIAGSRCL